MANDPLSNHLHINPPFNSGQSIIMTHKSWLSYRSSAVSFETPRPLLFFSVFSYQKSHSRHIREAPLSSTSLKCLTTVCIGLQFPHIVSHSGPL